LPQTNRREALQILSMLLERAAVAPGPVSTGNGGEHDAAA
jgi:hypothetical protein